MCTHTCTHMATKTISIKEEVYQKLVGLKHGNESFSDLLDRLASGVSSLEVLRHLRGSVEIEDRDKILTEIRKGREQFR